MTQRQVSAHTMAAYRDTFRLPLPDTPILSANRNGGRLSSRVGKHDAAA